MNFCHSVLMLVAGGATALGTAAFAHAEDPLELPPWGWDPPGIGGDLTNREYGPSGLWGSYDEPYTITDNGLSDGNVLGTYDAHESSYTALFLTGQSFQATDSIGDAPPDGTVWDYSTFGFPTGFGAAYPFLNHFTSGDDGTADWFQIAGIGFQNVFVSTPERTADYLALGPNFIPVFDTADDPFDPSSAADLCDPSSATAAFDAFDAAGP